MKTKERPTELVRPRQFPEALGSRTIVILDGHVKARQLRHSASSLWIPGFEDTNSG